MIGLRVSNSMDFSRSFSKWPFYLNYFEGCGKRLLASSGAAVAAAALLLTMPIFVRYGLDEVLPQRRYGTLFLIGVAMVIVQAGYLALSLWAKRHILEVSKHVTLRLRQDALRKLYTFSHRFYTRLSRGDLHAQFVVDSNRVDQMTQALVGGLLPALLTGILLGVAMLLTNWMLLVAAVVVFACFTPFIRWMAARIQRLSRHHYDAVRSYSSRLTFAISNFLLTTLKGAEKHEMDAQKPILAAMARSGCELGMWRAAFTEVQSLFAFGSAVAILGIGIGTTVLGMSTIGEVLAFYVLAMMFRSQYMHFSHALTPVLEGAQALATICDMMETEDDAVYCGTKELAFQGNLQFENVTFSYNEHPLLRQVNFSVASGQWVGIVGPNGSGKSTIMKLLLGFYRPETGRVRADGVPLELLDMNAFRRQIGVVTQEPTVFGGTVTENISYGEPHFTRAKVVNAARLAVAHNFILTLPNGYDTQVGDEGVRLSGGQKQKIAIARALAAEPSLLILDEPTNHLDDSSIDALLSNLAALPQRPTVIIISHDIRALRHADAVYGFEQGVFRAHDAHGRFLSANSAS